MATEQNMLDLFSGNSSNELKSVVMTMLNVSDSEISVRWKLSSDIQKSMAH